MSVAAAGAKRRCDWPGGCVTLLRATNAGTLCSLHEALRVGDRLRATALSGVERPVQLEVRPRLGVKPRYTAEQVLEVLRRNGFVARKAARELGCVSQTIKNTLRRAGAGDVLPLRDAARRSLERKVMKALARNGFCVKAAAAELGVHRNTVRNVALRKVAEGEASA